MTRTSLSIDREKVDAAGRILGTTSITTTIDAALTEIVNLDRRRRLVERMRRDGGIGPSDAELRRLRTP
jgi:Arc/MetJ family transcription regulator